MTWKNEPTRHRMSAMGIETTKSTPQHPSSPETLSIGEGTITGYRYPIFTDELQSIGKYGTFYYTKPHPNRVEPDTEKLKKELRFNNILIVPVLEYSAYAPFNTQTLFQYWFPDLNHKQIADDLNLTERKTEELIDMLVCEKARKLGYDGILFENGSIVDLDDYWFDYQDNETYKTIKEEYL